MIDNKTPYEKLFNKKHDYGNMMSFSCLALASNPERTKDKFAYKGVSYVFLGSPVLKKD